MVNQAFLVGVLFGIVPAMGFLYILLHSYQAFFEEKRVFKSFFLGLLGGLVATAILTFLGPGGRLDPASPADVGWGGLVVFAALFGLLEVAVATAFLNWRTYRGRKDTPFYAAAFGLGFGAVGAVFLVGRAVPALTAGGSARDAVVVVVLVGLYFMGAILVRAGAFVWIGQGVARGGLPRHAARAAAVVAGYTALFLALPRLHPVMANLMPLGAIALAIAFIAYILRTELDRVVPEEVLREAGIHRRRLARRRLREARSGHEQVPAGPGLEDETVPQERLK